MGKLSIGQRKALSSFLNTVATTWFSAGVITPFFLKPSSLIDTLVPLFIGIFAAFIFLYGSLYFVKGIKS